MVEELPRSESGPQCQTKLQAETACEAALEFEEEDFQEGWGSNPVRNVREHCEHCRGTALRARYSIVHPNLNPIQRKCSGQAYLTHMPDVPGSINTVGQTVTVQDVDEDEDTWSEGRDSRLRTTCIGT